MVEELRVFLRWEVKVCRLGFSLKDVLGGMMITRKVNITNKFIIECPLTISMQLVQYQE